MIIKSNFKDYYDCMAQYGTEDYIYLRKSESIDKLKRICTDRNITKYSYSKEFIDSWFELMKYIALILSFRDRITNEYFLRNRSESKIYNVLNFNLNYKLTPFITDIDVFIINGRPFFIYNNDIINFEYYIETFIINHINTKKISSREVNKIKKKLVEVSNGIDSFDFIIINNELDSPIIHFGLTYSLIDNYNPNHSNYYSDSYIIDIIKDQSLIKYIKYLPDQKYIWAELNNYFSNKKNKDYEDNFKNLADIDLLVKHGFDKDISFRKSKKI